MVASGASLRPLLSRNREWHVVVEHAGLAETFRDVLRWDFEEAERVLGGARPAAVSHARHSGRGSRRGPASAPRPARLSGEGDHQKRIRVQPILTPDNYAEHVLPLIHGAQRSLYFQNQYINVGENPTGEFRELLEALSAQSRDPALDVRIIVGSRDAQRKWGRMKDFGFAMERVKLQDNCHNKGIVVDGERVLVGSHNWSGDGTTYNRDASLLFDDAEIAEYYQQVFLHDWTDIGDRSHRARRGIRSR